MVYYALLAVDAFGTASIRLMLSAQLYYLSDIVDCQQRRSAVVEKPRTLHRKQTCNSNSEYYAGYYERQSKVLIVKFLVLYNVKY